MVNQLNLNKIELSNNSNVLELGTGWIHFYSIFLKIFNNNEYSTTLFDVIDNRQLKALQKTYSLLKNHIPDYFDLTNYELEKINNKIDNICSVKSFSELYSMLNFEYLVEDNGNVSYLLSNHYDLVFSFDVLEHVNAELLETTINEYFRIIKSGGTMIHQIGLDDHLTHYDKKVSGKQFLSYSNLEWKTKYQNSIQYFNRIPINAFKNLFKEAGFYCVTNEIEREPSVLNNIIISKDFNKLSQEDLEATRAFLVFRKP